MNLNELIVIEVASGINLALIKCLIRSDGWSANLLTEAVISFSHCHAIAI
jgi:hypothetical protein